MRPVLADLDRARRPESSRPTHREDGRVWASVPPLIAGLVLGFLAGLLTFRRTLRWCRACGETLTCARCVPVRKER